jgi:cell division protein FtsW (lipid II flippase)
VGGEEAVDAQGLHAAGDGRMTTLPGHAAARPSPDGVVRMPRGRRQTELLMLIFAVGLVLFAYLSVGLGLNGKVPAGIAEYGIGFAVIVFIAHLAVRRLAPWADPLLLPLAALLNGLGVVMIYRLQESGRNGNPGTQIVTITSSATAVQVFYSAVGVAAFVLVLVFIREVRVLQRYTYTLGALGLVLLAIPAMLPSRYSEVPGTAAKIQIAFGGLSFQPEEFGKLALAVFFAGYLVTKRDVLALAGRRFLGIDLPRARDLGPVLIAWGASLLVLIFEHDVGTSALFFGLFVAMIYVATQRTSWLLIGILQFVVGAYVASKLFSQVGARFTAWLHPFTAANVFCNPATQAHCVSSYQLVQGLYGMGIGGIFGTGLGHGQPFFTPLVQSDFVVTAFGEELGLTGLMALLLIFGLVVQRGLRAAVAVRDPFAKLLTGGLSFVLALQVFIIVGGVTNLIPLTGITTPFLSQGGSSLIASWALIGLLMRVSDTARRPAPQPIQDEGMTQVVRAG